MIKEPIALDDVSIPDSIDWRDKGAVNPVKNQGDCGSCWAFSAVVSTEGAHQIKTGTLLSLSEQQVVDCVTASSGCNGGLQSDAFDHYADHPADLESDYPYVSGQTTKAGTCKEDQYDGKVTVSDYDMVMPDSAKDLKAAIAVCPTSVSIEADKAVFQHYKSGILDSPECGVKLDHGVAAVGYGSEDGTDYYIVRNSWGPDWGESGYIRIAAVEGGDGICGIQLYSLYPTTN